MKRTTIGLMIVIGLGACTSSRTPAPIVIRPLPGAKPVPTKVATPTPAPVVQAVVAKPVADDPNLYVVKKGDGLYRIALDHGLYYRDLAEWNDITNVDEIKVDQVLRLTPPENTAGVEVRPLRDNAAPSPTPTPVPVPVLSFPKALKLPYGSQLAESLPKQADGAASAVAVASKPAAVVASRPVAATASTVVNKKQDKPVVIDSSTTSGSAENSIDWISPTAGKLLRPFSVESKGIDLSGKIGQSVVASESGKVVYAGSGLRGYGKMIIIKHDNAYLSAYAHNSKLVVKEGDAVKKGEKIAEMGNSDTDQVKLHFEIRKFGKPVDPTKLIAADRP